MSTLRLILWPTIVTMIVTVARLVAEVLGWVAPQSGGALHPLGITWIGFVAGGWFGWRLRQGGSRAALRFAGPLAVVAMVALAAAAAWQFAPLRDAGQSEDTFAMLRVAVMTLVAIATTLAVVMFVAWPRLAWALLCYGLIARGTVVAITGIAKLMAWNTHYTKFGPSGIERDMPTTLMSAAIAQGGFWIPFTVISGSAIGAWFGQKR